MPDQQVVIHQSSVSTPSSLAPVGSLEVALVAYNWEANTSLALWNLIGYARQDETVRDNVDFHEHCAATPKSQSAEEQELKNVLDWVEHNRFDVIGFSCYIWNIEFVLRAAKAIKANWPETVIVFGGQQIRGFYIRHVIERERCVDICVFDEAEVTFRNLLRYLISGSPSISSIGGLAYVAAQGDPECVHRFDDDGHMPAGSTYHETGQPVLIQDINDIPSSYLGDVDLPEGGAFLYEASRGCPYRCAFCIWGESQGVREYDIERVEAELRNMLRYQPSHIMFCDGTFNMRKRRAAYMLGILVEHLRDGRVQPFSLLLELKLEIIDDNLAAVMDELVRLNPLVTIEFGLQSASQKAAKLMQRPFSEERFRKAWNRLSDRLKSTAIIDCIYGLPGDGVEEFKYTVDFCYSLAPHRIQCFRLSILPGSEFERQAREHEIHFMRDPSHMVFSTKWLDRQAMAWTETFGFAVADLYHFHTTTIKCVLGLGESTGIGQFSALVTEFVDWAGRDRILGTSYQGNRPEGRWRAINLSGLFETFVFDVLLPRAGVDDRELVERLRAIYAYEATMGRIAIDGVRDTPVHVTGDDASQPTHSMDSDYVLRAEIAESRFDIPAFIEAARGRTEIDVRALAERASPMYIAFSHKAGHEGVLVPISYRLGQRLGVLLKRYTDGEEAVLGDSAVRALTHSGLVARAERPAAAMPH